MRILDDMKTVYFVRHGESESNAGSPTFLGPISKLTEKGRRQAEAIAERCARLSFDALITSHIVRAQETGEFITARTGKEPEVVELFAERRSPSQYRGRLRSDPEAQELNNKWLGSFYEEGIKIGDGENFQELKSRAREALRYLEARKESKLLVVSHGFILRMIFAQIMVGEAITAEEFRKFAQSMWADNTGLSVITYGEHKIEGIDLASSKRWVLRVWNDHAHLG